MKRWIRASYLKGMYELLEAYGGQALAENVFGPASITQSRVQDPYKPLDYTAAALVFDSILLNADSLSELCRLNGELKLVNPWGLGEVFAAQARSGTLLEYWTRLQSVARLMVSRWSSSLEDDGDVVTLVSDWSNYPGVGFPTLGAAVSIHRIKDLCGLTPIRLRMPYHASPIIRDRLAAEFPEVAMEFEPPLQMISYPRADILAAPPIPRIEGARVTHRALLEAYYSPNLRHYTVGILDALEAMIESGVEPTLEAAAAAVSIPPRELQRALQSGGLTMRSATERIRVGLAEELLAETDDLILDIALATGYTSHQALSKVFKRWRGLSPTEYRQFVARQRGRLAREHANAAG
ncbi:MAG: helix-turn-helix transcriptional regulator [Gammaproteobacteria bacterium]